MSEGTKQADTKAVGRISLDTWTVLIGLAVAVLVRVGWLKHVSW